MILHLLIEGAIWYLFDILVVIITTGKGLEQIPDQQHNGNNQYRADNERCGTAPLGWPTTIRTIPTVGAL
jgi:hypothetical protein